MPRLSFASRIVVLGLVAALIVPWSASAALGTQLAPSAGLASATGDLLHQLWSLWSRLWSVGWPADTLDEGCHLDPSGRCLDAPTSAPTETLDEGCHADPNGHCFAGS